MRPARARMIGAGVLLSDSVICDGFADGVPVRAQSHTHEDHMEFFDRSTGRQQIFALPATIETLIEQGPPALRYRNNLHALPAGIPVEVGNSEEMLLLPSGHMLGSAQVAVTHRDGYRVGYSGDFDFPIADVIQVDELVVDSTYGGVSSNRPYSNEQAEEEFAALFYARIKRGPVLLRAHRGIIPRALELVGDKLSAPALLTRKHFLDCKVSRNYGLAVPDVALVEDARIETALRDGARVVATSLGSRYAPESNELSVIALRAAWTQKSPTLQVSDTVWHVGISAHADLEGTLEYIAASGADLVLTDNVRGPHGVELAITVKERLGIDARCCDASLGLGWGDGG